MAKGKGQNIVVNLMKILPLGKFSEAKLAVSMAVSDGHAPSHSGFRSWFVLQMDIHSFM